MKRKQILLNIGANFLSVLIGLSISFFLTPFIVKNIGKEAYSFIPISSNFLSYLSILTLAITSMTSRFVTLKLHQENIDVAKDYYSTSFYLNLICSSVVFLISLFIVIFLDKIINIPANILLDVQLLFVLMFLTFITNLVTIVFSVPTFIANRLDINSSISIAGSVIRLVVIFITFRYFKSHVYYIGLSLFAVVLVQGLLSYIMSKKIMPALKISFKRVQVKIVKELFGSGVWNSFNQLSAILLTGLDLLIANIIFGASASGTLAIAKTAPMALQVLITIVPTAFIPYLTILYAKSNRLYFIKELNYILKFSAIIIGIPIAGFIALSSVFFRMWVPSIANTQLTILAILTMISMISNFSIMPIIHIFTITNKLKWPSFVTFISGILNVVIVLTIIKNSDLNLYAIAGVSSFLEILRCLIFVPIYASLCLKEKITIFYPTIIRSLGYMFILIIFYSLFNIFLKINSWFMLIIVSILMSIFGLFFGIMYVLNKEEKTKVFQSIIVQLKK